MKKLHHPGTPCNGIIQKDYSLSEIEGKNLELVKCSEGWGLFGEDEFWISDGEKEILESKKEIRQFIPEETRVKDWGFYSPIDIEIELTKKCNQRCIHCWNESGKNIVIPNKKLEEIVREFRNSGGQKIKLTGGEPLQHPNFFEFLDYSKNSGIKNIELTTNGSLINEKNIGKLSEYIDKLNISLHGATEEVHNQITQTKNYYKTIDAIKRSRLVGLDTTINFTVMEENESEIEDLFYLAEEMSSKIRFNLLMQIGYGKNLGDVSDQFLRLRNQIFDLSKKYRVSLERSGLYPAGYNEGLGNSKFYGCSALRRGLFVTAEGLVLPCNQSRKPIGDIYSNSIKEIWRSKEAENVRDITSCELRNCGVLCSSKCKASEI